MTSSPPPEERTHAGSVKDRRQEAPWWLWFVLSAVVIALICAGVIVLESSRAADHAEQSARNATAALGASRAATDRLHAAAFGACRRLEVERERVNSDNATIWLVLRQARETTPPRGRPVLQRLARSTTYGPPANCQEAVDRPASYRPPHTIPYSSLPIHFAEAVERAAITDEPQPHPVGRR